MRALIIATLLAGNGFANGVLSLNQDLIEPNNLVELRPTLSLRVYEPIGSGIYYRNWTGLRLNRWFITDHSFMMPVVDKFNLGIGPSYISENGSKVFSIKLYGELGLW
jgi:hypothetical protein